MILTNWVKNLEILEAQPSAHFCEWLTKPYVLSEALKRIAKSLHINVLSQAFEDMLEDEYERFGKASASFVRQVFLENEGVPWTYGRVVLPSDVYARHFADFDSLGNQPIGEALLYNNPDVTRSAFEYAALTLSHPLYRAINDHFFLSAPTLWARRSLFLMKRDPLLITEVFLPTLPCFPS